MKCGAKKVNLEGFDPLIVDDLVESILLNNKKISGVNLGYIGNNKTVVDDYIKKELYEENIKHYMKAEGMTRKEAIEFLKENMSFEFDIDGALIEASLGMVFNERYIGDIERILDNELTQYLTGERAYGNGTIMTTFTHEYGHRVSKLIAEKGGNIKDIMDSVNKKYPNTFVSEYATENTSEMFSEFYADYVLNPNKSEGVEYFGKQLEKFFK